MVLGIEIPFTVVTVLIVAARMVAPWFTKRTLAVEDWTMMVACVNNFPRFEVAMNADFGKGFNYRSWDHQLHIGEHRFRLSFMGF